MGQFKRSDNFQWQSYPSTVRPNRPRGFSVPSQLAVKESRHIRVFIHPEVHERLVLPSPCPHTVCVVNRAIEMAMGKSQISYGSFMSCDLTISPLPLGHNEECILYITNKGDAQLGYFLNPERARENISNAVELSIT